MIDSMNKLNKTCFGRGKNNENGSLAFELMAIIGIVLFAICIGSLVLGATNDRTSRIADAIKSPPPTSAVSPTPSSSTPSNTGW